ncbi:hypothetical protein AXF42_Ash004634 [Apostasia shenzhenica]|uniref:Uncharacterized protein n=1 Tax=Apostasia shenzhenica TaxID=1088818 RepID=A0A2I0BH80_9ASPA|nr:hypothetical protein AXF42_Ash004634 [Apostasia shenzhenica]
MADRERTPSWGDCIDTLTHILTYPTTTPSLHSQLFVASRVPCFLRWDYPPFLCPDPTPTILRWAEGLFRRRVAKFGRLQASWRSKCPFQQPPPLVLSTAVKPAPPRWMPENLREHFRQRIQRGRLGLRVSPLLVVTVPNLLLLLLLFCDPDWYRCQEKW